MITIFANNTKLHLPMVKGMAVAPRRHQVHLQAVSGGMIHQIIGGMSATTGAPVWQGELRDDLVTTLKAMHTASSTCHLTVDEKVYRCTWQLEPDILNGSRRQVKITWWVVEDVTPC
jgi:hypothetical protein